MAEQPIVSVVEPYQSESLVRLAHEPLGTDQPQAGKDPLKQELTFSFNIALHDNSRAPRQYKILFPSHMERSEICGLLLVSIYNSSQPQYQYEMTFKATETLMALNLRSCKIEHTGTNYVSAGTVKPNTWYVWANTYPVTFRVKLEYVAEVSETFAQFVHKSLEQDPLLAPKCLLLHDASSTGDLQLVCEVSQSFPLRKTQDGSKTKWFNAELLQRVAVNRTSRRPVSRDLCLRSSIMCKTVKS
jgi:hypothetical protein